MLPGEVMSMTRIRRSGVVLALASALLVAGVGCTLLNRAPVAGFTVTPDTGTAPLTVDVDASASTDPDDDALSYQWSFGDGSFATGVIASHTYNNSGQFTIELTVTDATGRQAAAFQTVTVEPDTGGPTASFTASPSSGGTPLTVAFNASASTDPDGVIVSYAWSFGDGSTATGVSPLHTYDAEGSYVATLTVTDDDAQSDTATMTIVVIDGGQGGCQ